MRPTATPSREQLKLLLQAAEEICTNSEVRLDMSLFRSNLSAGVDYHWPTEQSSLVEPCGTSGCFLGWCPFLGIPELALTGEDTSIGGVTVDFPHYGERVFSIFPFEKGWDWFFSERWPNDKDELLARVCYYIIEGGSVPPDFFGDEGGEDEEGNCIMDSFDLSRLLFTEGHPYTLQAAKEALDMGDEDKTPSTAVKLRDQFKLPRY